MEERNNREVALWVAMLSNFISIKKSSLELKAHL